jgi:Mannitol dehydrogenase C-terminal domain
MLHTGCGKLGLGLVLPIIQAGGLPVKVCGRENSESLTALRRSPLYRRLDEIGNEIGQVRIDEFLGFGEACERISDGTVRVFTISVGKFLESVCHQIEDSLALRASSGPPMAVIACENDIGAYYPEMAKRLSSGSVEFLPCVVDRVCPKEPLGDPLAVQSEYFGEWIVQRPRSEELADLLDAIAVATQASLFESGRFVVVDDVEPFELRKRWVVNGLHVALALAGFLNGPPRIRDVLEHESGVATLRRAEPFLMRAANSLEAFNNEINAEYIKRTFERMEGPAGDDGCGRILSRFKRTYLSEFYSNFDRKVSEACRADPDQNSKDFVHALLDTTVNLVRDEIYSKDNLQDWPDRAMESQYADDALKAFDAAAQGIVGGEDLVILRGRLDQALRNSVADHGAS